MRFGRRLLFLALAAGLLGAAAGCWGNKGPVRLQGAGSSFVDPLMQEWIEAYKGSGEVNYQSKGSGAGIVMLTNKEVDFGCSDVPLNDEQTRQAQEKGGDVIHVPLCLGAIVPIYNLDVPGLVFSGPVLRDIYLGKITRWNDEAIARLNPEKKDRLPDLAISVVYRADSSGSTDILTDYFSKLDKAAWPPGRGTAIAFPKGSGEKGSTALAGFVKQTKGAIGYVEITYAIKSHIPYGQMVNAAGKTVSADTKSVTAAAATADIPDDLKYSITNAPGEGAWPLAGTVWAITYVKQPARRAEPLRGFLHWVTHDGQQLAEKLHYAPLPEAIVKKIDAKLQLIVAK